MSTLSNANAPLGDRVVLIVEDETSLLSALAKFLRLKGVRVVEAESGDDALDILAGEQRIDLVLSDIEMPGKTDGLTLLQWIRANRPALPIVLTSGRRGADDLDVPFLPKPYRMSELLPLIERYDARLDA